MHWAYFIGITAWSHDSRRSGRGHRDNIRARICNQDPHTYRLFEGDATEQSNVRQFNMRGPRALDLLHASAVSLLAMLKECSTS